MCRRRFLSDNSRCTSKTCLFLLAPLKGKPAVTILGQHLKVKNKEVFRSTIKWQQVKGLGEEIPENTLDTKIHILCALKGVSKWVKMRHYVIKKVDGIKVDKSLRKKL